MDNIFFGRLICIFFVFGSLFFVSPCHAAIDRAGAEGMAMASCRDYAAEDANTCVLKYSYAGSGGYVSSPPPYTVSGTVKGFYTRPSGAVGSAQGFSFWAVTPAMCSAQPSKHFGSTNLSGTELTCYQGCEYGFSPDQGQVQVCLGSHCTSGQSGTIGPTGQTCSSEGGPAPPSYTPPPLSKLCGGGSCYDPGSGKYCAVGADGQQVCVDARQAANGGGSSTSSDSALAAGNPPPSPPNPPISNPPTDIQSSDTYQQNSTDAQGNPLPGQPITVNTYGKNGAPTSSGQGEGDTGPAPPSSTGDPAGSVSGGLDCNTPPICSGDVVNCAVVNQAWLARCHNHDDLDQLHKDLAGTEAPTGAGEVGQGDVWTNGVSGSSVGEAALQGNFDESGMGFSMTCPLKDLTISLPGGRSFAVPFSKGCQYGDWIRNIVIAFALFAAARIIAKG